MRTQRTNHRLLQSVTWTLLSVAVGVALAAGESVLPDPTRPPDGLIGLPATGEPAVPAEPRLQSVLIGSAGRSAIIDGQRYKVGDRVGDARLVKISENEVILTNSGGRQTMRLFPSVKKTSPERATPARRGASRNP